SASCSQTVVVIDTTPPTITCPAAVSPIQCPNTPVFPTPIVSDTCDPSPKVTSNDVVTAGSCPGTYSVTRTWTATDCNSNSATCSQTVVIIDTAPPTITCPTAVSPIQCPNTPVFPAPIVSDTCDPSPKVTSNDVVTAASCSQTVLVIDTAPPTITCPAAVSPIQCPNSPIFPRPTVSDTCDSSPKVTSNDVVTAGSCAGTYSVTRTWTATDCNSNSASCSQTVVVIDTTPPTITCPAAVSPIQCPNTP